MTDIKEIADAISRDYKTMSELSIALANARAEIAEARRIMKCAAHVTLVEWCQASVDDLAATDMTMRENDSMRAGLAECQAHETAQADVIEAQRLNLDALRNVMRDITLPDCMCGRCRAFRAALEGVSPADDMTDGGV